MVQWKALKNIFRTTLFFVALSIVLSCSATSRDNDVITLRVHHLMPPTSVAQKQFLEPWAKQIEAESGGRFNVEIYPAMLLGGSPTQLFDQVRDGVVDLAWTVTGYTPGRFPLVEVFELPFVSASAEVTNQALQTFYEKHLVEEFQAVHPILLHVHAPGKFHMNGKAIQSLEDLKGLKIRAPTRVTNKALQLLGATPVGMAVPEVPEALAKGVVDGTLLPYEGALALRIHELTDTHTEIGGERGLYTSIFLLAMNKNKYESLPDNLKQVIDNHSGMAMAQAVGKVWDQAELTGLEAAQGTFYQIEGEELERWKAVTAPVIDSWIADIEAKGKDGRALLNDARTLINQYHSEARSQ